MPTSRIRFEVAPPENTKVSRTAARQLARAYLTSLNVGDVVRVTEDGQTIDMTVKSPLTRDASGFGSWESARVGLTLGPGRYSLELSSETLATGRISLERVGSHTDLR